MSAVMRRISGWIVVLGLLTLSTVARADWVLNPKNSAITYVSVKNNAIAENNSFHTFAGSVADSGAAEISIALASVETGIEIRNERVRKFLFEVGAYPTATISAALDPALFARLTPSQQERLSLDLRLEAHGVTLPLEAHVFITPVTADRILVTTAEPVIIAADELNLLAGLKTLRQIAGLDSIAQTVPVSFTLTFDRTDS